MTKSPFRSFFIEHSSWTRDRPPEISQEIVANVRFYLFSSLFFTHGNVAGENRLIKTPNGIKRGSFRVEAKNDWSPCKSQRFTLLNLALLFLWLDAAVVWPIRCPGGSEMPHRTTSGGNTKFSNMRISSDENMEKCFSESTKSGSLRRKLITRWKC